MPIPAAAWPAIGAIGGGLLDMLGQSSANKANLAIAREQMDFQERMSSTAIQRRVMDLQAAGLNPMLGYSSEASSPQGAKAEMQSVTGGRAGDRALGAVSTAMAAKVQAQQIETMKAEQALKAAEVQSTLATAAKTIAETPGAGQTPARIEAGIGVDLASAGQARAQTEVLNKQVERLVEDIAHIRSQIQGQGLSNELAQRTMDAQVALKALESKAKALDMPRLENLNKAQEAIRSVVEGESWISRFGSWVGGNLADRDEQIRALGDRYREWKRRNSVPRPKE